MATLPSSRSRSIARGRSVPVADDVLLEAIARGDLGALAEIYDRYHEDLRRVVCRTRVPSPDADDVVHAVFMKLPEIAQSFEGAGSCRTWLSGIAVNFALRHRRSFGRWLRAVASFATTVEHETTRTPETIAAGAEELRALDRALGRLSARKRAVFVLIEMEGLGAEEAGHALGVPTATVRTRLFHAKKELRSAMQRGGAW